MRHSTIILTKDEILCDGKSFFKEEVNRIERSIKKCIKVFILERELEIDVFDVKEKISNIENFISNIMGNNYIENGDILYNYEYDKKLKKIYIYYIKGFKYVRNIISQAKELQIKPIQSLIYDVCKHKLKIKDVNFSVLLKFGNYYYYTLFKNGNIVKSLCSDSINEINFEIIKHEDKIRIYVDNKIEQKLAIQNKILIDLSEIIYDKIYKK